MNEIWFNKFCLSFSENRRGIPFCLQDVADAAAQRLRKPCEFPCDRALEFLLAAKYLARCELTAADEPLYKITADGIRQIFKKVPPAEVDPMIHGG